MHAALSALTAGSATPMPSLTVDPEVVTPGPIGFAVFALLTLAVIALIWDMLRRIRRGRYRSEVNEELDAEDRARAESDAQARRATEASDVDDQDVDPGADPARR